MSHMSLPENQPDAPFMKAHEIEAIRAVLEGFHRPVHVLEWGSGRSTVFFSRLLPSGSSWFSIEHQPYWHALVAEMLRPEDRKTVSCALVEPDRPYVEGTDDGDFSSFRSYILYPARLQKRFDFILVDGRARVECMAIAWDLLSEDGVMALHDAQREEYAPGVPSGCTYLKLSDTTESMEAPPALLFMARKSERLMPLRESLSRHLPPGVIVESNFDPSSVCGGRSALFVNTYYGGFLQTHYTRHAGLEAQPYRLQKESLQRQCFGDSDFYSVGLAAAGWRADDQIANCAPLQQAWARENACEGLDLQEILLEQIRRASPDVVYLQDLNMATTDFITAIRPHTRLIAGQIASPVPPQADLQGLDIIFSSFPHFVERFRSMGITAYYQPLAFEPRVLELLPRSEREWPVTFVGGISPHHGKGLETLQKIADLVPLDCWGYGAAALPPESPLRTRHHGEVWGLDMFAVLHRSMITLNRHIDVAEDAANNMRLFEATGCGALLVTDYKDNLNELFEIGTEVVAYRSPEECAALIRYYQANPAEAAAIARAGQARTLRDHTYGQRMRQTAEILERHVRYSQERNKFPAINYSHISYDYNNLQPDEVVPSMELGWQDATIPFRQRALVQVELDALYHGRPPLPFRVLAELLKPVVCDGMSLLEIGCASGYYSEALEYMLSRQLDYTGVDYSETMIAMAQDYYPHRNFRVADGAQLPFADGFFSLVISGSVLLHTSNYVRHIAETARVAKTWIVVHRSLVCRNSPTFYLTKKAYGVETVELRFNEKELLSHFSQNGFELKRELVYAEHPEIDQYEVSYLLQRTVPSVAATDAAAPRSTTASGTISRRRGPVVLVSRAIAFAFPLSYAYLAGQLRSRGEDVRVLFKDATMEILVKQIMDLNPLVVGFGSLYPELAETKTLIEMLDAAGRTFPIVIGGQMVSPIPEFAVRVTGADYGIIGEGELILAELVERLRNGDDITDLKGLVINYGGEIKNNGPGAYIEDLSNGLPHIPYELFPVDQWLPIGEWYAKNRPQPHWRKEDRVINVHGGRGCPFSCNFCYHHSKPRYRDIAVMMEEAQEALIRFNGNMLYFSDDLVLTTPERARELIECVHQLDRPISFSLSSRFDILARMDTGLLKELKRAGCRTMGLGLESGSDRILKIIGKNCTVQQINDGLERLHAVGIYPSTAIMVGQFTETLDDVAASLALMQQAVRRDPQININFTLTTPFPGSQLYAYILGKGILRDDQDFYDRYFATPEDFKQVVNISSMSEDEVYAGFNALQRAYDLEKQRQSHLSGRQSR